MRAMTARERHLVALAVLAALLMGLWALILDPVVGGHFRRQEESARLAAQLARDERLVVGLEEWKAVADEQARTAASFALQAPTAALATEALKERVIAAVTAEGGMVKALQAVDRDVPEHWVRVRADLRLSHEQLYGALRRLASEVPYVVIDFLSVVADRAAGTGRLEPLDASVVVSSAIQLSADQTRSPLGPPFGQRGAARPCRRASIVSRRPAPATRRPARDGRFGAGTGGGDERGELAADIVTSFVRPGSSPGVSNGAAIFAG